VCCNGLQCVAAWCSAVLRGAVFRQCVAETMCSEHDREENVVGV